MECMNDNCTNALTGRQRRFCSDKCRKAQNRTDKANEDAPEWTNPDRLVVNTQPGHKADKIEGLKKITDNTWAETADAHFNRVHPEVVWESEPSAVEAVDEILTGRSQAEPKNRRGKDIKAFADLSLDVQQSINSMSIIDGKLD